MGCKIWATQPDKKKKYVLSMDFIYEGVSEAWSGRRVTREALLKLMGKELDRYLDRMAEEIKKKPKIVEEQRRW